MNNVSCPLLTSGVKLMFSVSPFISTISNLFDTLIFYKLVYEIIVNNFIFNFVKYE